MARTKQRSVNVYRGRRRPRRVTKRIELIAQETVAAGESASAKKMDVFGISLESLQIERDSSSIVTKGSDDMFLIVQHSSLISLFSKLICPKCFSPGVTLKILDGMACGFAMQGTVICSTCDEVIHEEYLCQRIGGTKSTKAPFEINTRATLAFRGIGCGFTAMKEWCGIMNIPHTMSLVSFSSHQKKLHGASLVMTENVREQSKQAIRKAYKKIGINEDEDGILNIGVSFDGSWQRRGHSSHNGLASVIDLITGLPVDFEVLSNFCFKCKVASDRPDDPAWREKHQANCWLNFDGSSNAMEVECALRIWHRSVQLNKLRYTTMLCDGDSKAFDAVVSKKPYGEITPIEKEDCINHVSKRMGTALRNLVAESRAQRDSVSGKGKLTQEKINKIQNYYGRAIKDNADDVEVAKKRIFAILLHLSSSDAHPKHVHCPPGERSWCFWQRACAKNINPGSHKEHETLPSDIGKKLVPIFNRLSDPGLLKRCSKARTQNPNDAMHHLIWKLCPKQTYVGRNTIETAVAMAVCQFSMGSSFRQTIFTVLGIEVLRTSSIAKDIGRLKKAEKAS